MGEHLAPEPQYKQPTYSIESPTPMHDFASRSVEDIEDAVSSGVRDYLDNVDEDAISKDDDPQYQAAARKLNQLKWELSLLPDQDLERGKLVSEALIMEDSGEISNNMGISMLPALFNQDFETAMALMIKAVLKEAHYSDHLAFDVGAELHNAAQEQRIDSTISGKIMWRLAVALAGSAQNTAEHKVVRDKAEAERDRALVLAQAAASRAGVQINAKHIHLSDSTFGDGVTKNFGKKSKKNRGQPQSESDQTYGFHDYEPGEQTSWDDEPEK